MQPKEKKDLSDPISEPVVTDITQAATDVADSQSAPNPSSVAEFNSLKQKRIAEVKQKENSGVLGEPGGMIAGRTASYGGNDAAIAGSIATTPGAKENYTRRDTRFSKKVDSTARKVSELASEQVDVEVIGPKTLHENRGAVQGARGVVRNKITARTKTKGITPASHMFQRSLDILEKDNIVFGTGQSVKSSTAAYRDIPTATLVFDADTQKWSVASALIGARGNYIPKQLKFKINGSGVVTDMSFTSDDISYVGDDENVINKAAPHAKIHSNTIELQRRIMVEKAGDESLAGWSPLPIAISQPNETISFLKDVEQDTGNAAYMAHRFLSLGLAYQLNRAGKDGNVQGQPVDEMFLKVIKGPRDFTDLKAGVQAVVGKDTRDDMKIGSPSLILNAFDSTTKYRNKGDVLTMPNSFKSILFGGQNYMGGLRANKQLVKLIEGTQAISTIDGEYDGIRPVYQDDNYLMTTPVKWDDIFRIVGATAYDPYQFNQGITYGFKDHRGWYYTTVNHPLLKGIYDWLSEKGMSLVKTVGSDVEVTIPIVYSLTSVTTWELLVMAAMNKIELARNTSLRDLITYEQAHGQVFDDLLPLQGYPTTASRQFDFVSIEEPIKIGRIRPEILHRFTMPEVFWSQDERAKDSNSAQNVVLPWYMNEAELENDGIKKVISNPYSNVVSFPMVRSGIVLDSLLKLVQEDERQVRLGLDRLVLPLAKEYAYDDLRIYKYDLAADGIPTVKVGSDYTVGMYLKQPRELGLIFTAPAGYVIPKGDGKLVKLSDRWRADTSWRAKIYVGSLSDGIKPLTDGNVFDNASINIDRGSVYFQEFYYLEAAYGATYLEGGLPLAMRDVVSWTTGDVAQLEVGQVVLKPFTAFGTGQGQAWKDDADSEVVSFHRHNWVRAQLVPFIVSPFDTIKQNDATGKEDGQKFDPFDQAYTFGLVGFAASDYGEDHFNRMNKQIQEGYQFTEDVYLIDTPLLQ